MDEFTRLFGNPTIAAFANFLAVLGGLLFSWKIIKFVVAFIKNAYHSSVKAAVRQLRRAFRLEALVCSNDLTVYISSLVRYSLAVFLSSLAILVGILAPPAHDNQKHFFDWLHTSTVDTIFKIATTIWILVFAASALRLIRFSRDVGRFKLKALRRQRLAKDD